MLERNATALAAGRKVGANDPAGSADRCRRPSDHSLAVVRFAPKASQDDIAKFLDRNKASVVEGPKSGGLYTLRLPATGEAKTDLIKQMQANSAVVEFIADVQ